MYPPKGIAPTNPEGTEAYVPPLTPQERVAALAALYAAAGAQLAVEK